MPKSSESMPIELGSGTWVRRVSGVSGFSGDPGSRFGGMSGIVSEGEPGTVNGGSNVDGVEPMSEPSPRSPSKKPPTAANGNENTDSTSSSSVSHAPTSAAPR